MIILNSKRITLCRRYCSVLKGEDNSFQVEKPKLSYAKRLISMALVEKKLISISLVALGVSSSSTLAFPFALGKVCFLSFCQINQFRLLICLRLVVKWRCISIFICWYSSSRLIKLIFT